jgi:hypothetical protein
LIIESNSIQPLSPCCSGYRLTHPEVGLAGPRVEEQRLLVRVQLAGDRHQALLDIHDGLDQIAEQAPRPACAGG